MKPAALLVTALFVLLWLVPKPEAAAYKCILPNSCEPPPCEFWAELMINLASERALLRARTPRNNSRAAERRMWKEINRELAKPGFRYTPCAPYDKPDFVVTEAPQCEIGVEGAGDTFRPVTLDAALRESRGCSELVEAAFAGAKEEQDNCRFFAGQSNLSLAQQRANAFVEVQATADSLRNSLLQYLSSCTPNADVERQIAEASLDALKQEGEQARTAWQARRAEAAAGR